MRSELLRASILVALLVPAASARAAGPVGRWLGQDGKDFVGLKPEPGPSRVVDIHLALADLPRRPIVWAQVTGVGGGRWHTKQADLWRAHLLRSADGARADLFIEPSQVETGSRDFEVQIQFDTGPVVYVWIKGGKADPAFRVASAKGVARWGGMTNEDHVGAGPSVGPDGRRDAKILLEKLSADAEVESIRVSLKDAPGWAFGLNPEAVDNAEYYRDPRDPTRGVLFIQPSTDLNGRTLALRIVYRGGAPDALSVVAGKTEVVPVESVWKLPGFVPFQGKATWLGQDGVKRVGHGDVHVLIEGVPAERKVVAAELSDRSGSVWVWRGEGGEGFAVDADPQPMVLTRAPKSGTYHLAFPPVTREVGRRMTLRLGFADGKQGLVYFEGGKADPDLRSPAPTPTSVDAAPGDDLNALANRYGRVRLKPGVHRMSRPLVLNHPVAIEGPGATLEFRQAADQAPWTAAIKIHAGRTTLDGFAIRFAAPVRWDAGVGHGPAVIGTTDDRDKGPHPDKFGIALTRLDIQGPPAEPGWRDALPTARLTNARSGRIEENAIVGGLVEFWGGPWRIVGNTHRGTVANTHSHGVFCGHFTHDVLVEKNKATTAPGVDGKTWRFLVLTQRGYRDVVRDNVVEGIGAREDDAHPHPNAPEIILTEAYRIHFEGKPSFLQSSLLKTPKPQGEPAAAGDVLAILTGPNAGQWGTVLQNIGDSTYLLDRAWPAGTENEVVALVSGFVEDRFERNVVDTTGSTICYNLVLAGNHFGCLVEKNRLVGGGEGFRLLATASESPRYWGWSHAPVFGATLRDNVVENAWNGSRIALEHTQHIKTNRGRLYLEATLSGNHYVVSKAFASRRLQAKDKPTVARLTLNDPKPLDPSELTVVESGDLAEGSRGIPSLRIHGAKINGRLVRSGVEEFAPAVSARRGAPAAR